MSIYFNTFSQLKHKNSSRVPRVHEWKSVIEFCDANLRKSIREYSREIAFFSNLQKRLDKFLLSDIVCSTCIFCSFYCFYCKFVRIRLWRWKGGLKMDSNLITVKEIAQKLDIPFSTINHYTNLGLLRVVAKKKNRRLYDEDEVKERLAKISQLIDEGYPLKLIRRTLVQRKLNGSTLSN